MRFVNRGRGLVAAAATAVAACAAAAGRYDVGGLDNEPAAHQALCVVDGCAIEQGRAVDVCDDADTGLVQHHVVVFQAILEGEHVLSAVAVRHDDDAERRLRLSFFGENLCQFLGCEIGNP